MFIFSSLIAMAQDRALFRRRVQELSIVINEHLVKLMSISDEQNEKHWIKELDSWLRKINNSRVKSSIKPKAIFDDLINYDFSGVQGIVLGYAEENDSETALVFDNCRESCDLIPSILDEFAHLPLRSFVTIRKLSSFKDALSKRGKKGVTLFTAEELMDDLRSL